MPEEALSPARRAALLALDQIDPIAYGQSRNYLDNAVTRLSRYLRHGVLSLAEVRDAAIARAGGASRCAKLIQELAWRDYFQQVWRVLGPNVWRDIEPYKTGFDANDYADELPGDLIEARTGVDYVDAFVRELHETGYLHNHARMWLAAYVVHGRRVKWQAGARWFLSHLLDGDEASNNLSWQWCASTFAAKAYFFNRENVNKFAGGRFAEHDADDPFDDDYEAIAAKLFRPPDMTEPQRRFDLKAEFESPKPPQAVPAGAITWVHDGMMSPEHPAVRATGRVFFVWDDPHYAKRRFSDKRRQFIRSALFCDDHAAGERELGETVLDVVRAASADCVVTGDSPDPRVRQAIDFLSGHVETIVLPEPAFVELTGRVDLSRFSRYWGRAEKKMLR